MALLKNREEQRKNLRAGLEQRNARLSATEIPPRRGENAQHDANARKGVVIDSSTHAMSGETRKNDGARYNLQAIWLRRSQIKKSSKFGRTYFDPEEQADRNASVAEHGILEPLLVRPIESFEPGITHELIGGYSRDLSAEVNGMEWVPCVERVMTDVEAAVISLSENLQRTNPSPADLGRSLANLKTVMQTELNRLLQTLHPDPNNAKPKLLVAKYLQVREEWLADKNIPQWIHAVMERSQELVEKGSDRRPTVNWEDVGLAVKRSKRSMQYLVKITKLPPDVIKAVEEKQLTERQAREIAQLDDAAAQSTLARKAIRKGLSSEAIANEVRVQKGRAPRERSTSSGNGSSSHYGSQSHISALVDTPPTDPLEIVTKVADIVETGSYAPFMGAAATTLKTATISREYRSNMRRELQRIRAVHREEARQLEALEEVLGTF